MPRQRTLDPHKFTAAYASTKCIRCKQNEKHWLHRGFFYRMFHSRPGNVSIPRPR